MRYLVPIGRICFAAIFFLSSFEHFQKSTIEFAAKQGVPLASIAVPVSGAMALVGAILIILGYKAKFGAWLIVLFLVPVTLMMHNFWTVKDPMMYGIQRIMFLKNLAMLGGALVLTYFGAGPCSLDALLKKRKDADRGEGLGAGG